MLEISYRDRDRRAVIRWSPDDDEQDWLRIIRRIAFEESEETSYEGGHGISIPWWAFLALRHRLGELFKAYGLSVGKNVLIDSRATELLRQSTANVRSYSAVSESNLTDLHLISDRLNTARFRRRLTPQQERNVRRLTALPAAATFSVPGAGKTTEALAAFFYRASDTDRLLVIAPKNAFGAWDEQLEACLPELRGRFVRLQGGSDRISRILDSDPRFMLITYQQLARVREQIAEHIARHRSYVFLDESHRIKSGIGRVTAHSVLSIAHLPAGKLIMSGTPMPQSLDDLIPQFAFLYPEVPATVDTVVQLMTPIFVRTTKSELGLPPVERVVCRIALAPVQQNLYDLMRSELAREAANALSTRSRQAFRSLGRSVARLLQFVSNPALLSEEIEFAHPDLLRLVLAEGDSPKIRRVIRRTRELVRAGHKVLIWTSFVRNVEYLASRLSDLGTVYIHGGVDTGDEDDDDSREGRIKLFHDDPSIRVMVANPAAAAEGISLHRVCHHAIYLDRTFNAAHYLQSEDRIHRLGLLPDQTTFIEIVEGIGTIDEVVQDRLNYKTSQMAQALNDPNLRIDPIPLDPVSIDDSEEYGIGLGSDDAETLLRHLLRKVA